MKKFLLNLKKHFLHFNFLFSIAIIFVFSSFVLGSEKPNTTYSLPNQQQQLTAPKIIDENFTAGPLIAIKQNVCNFHIDHDSDTLSYLIKKTLTLDRKKLIDNLYYKILICFDNKLNIESKNDVSIKIKNKINIFKQLNENDKKQKKNLALQRLVPLAKVIYLLAANVQAKKDNHDFFTKKLAKIIHSDKNKNCSNDIFAELQSLLKDHKPTFDRIELIDAINAIPEKELSYPEQLAYGAQQLTLSVCLTASEVIGYRMVTHLLPNKTEKMDYYCNEFTQINQHLANKIEKASQLMRKK